MFSFEIHAIFFIGGCYILCMDRLNVLLHSLLVNPNHMHALVFKLLAEMARKCRPRKEGNGIVTQAGLEPNNSSLK